MNQLSRRRFFVHSAHRTIGVSAGLAALEAADSAHRFAASAAEPPRSVKPLSIAMLSGSEEYRSDASLTAFQAVLEKRFKMRCVPIFARGDELPGLDRLADCDCMIVFTRRLKLAEQSLDRIRDYCRSGRAIVGIRTASHAFQTWLAMDKEVFGGDYQGHYANKEKPSIKPAAVRHPVLEGVEPFVSTGSLYKNPHPADDITVLLTGELPGRREPAAWVRSYREARVFYTSLGTPDDFEHPSFRRLLTNAIFWTTRTKPAAS